MRFHFIDSSRKAYPLYLLCKVMEVSVVAITAGANEGNPPEKKNVISSFLWLRRSIKNHAQLMARDVLPKNCSLRASLVESTKQAP